MKRPTFILITCSAVLSAALIFWLVPGKAPGGNDGWSHGNNVGFINLPAGVSGDTLIPILERSGFVRIEDKTFDAIVPSDQSHPCYIGLVAFQDNSAQQPNRLVLGVGASDTIFYHESHDRSISSGEKWKDHIGKQVLLVKRLASNP